MSQPYPPQQPHPVPPYHLVQYPPQPRNGLGTAGFVLGLVGVIFSVIPVIGVVAWFLVLPGLVLAAVGLSQAHKGVATNKGLAVAGLVLSIVGLAFCVLYATAFAAAVSAPTVVHP